MLAGGLLGLPLVAIPLAVALGHFILEERFNRDLLIDLVARPTARAPKIASGAFAGKVPAALEVG
jgi:hypothetical protein